MKKLQHFFEDQLCPKEPSYLVKCCHMHVACVAPNKVDATDYDSDIIFVETV